MTTYHSIKSGQNIEKKAMSRADPPPLSKFERKTKTPGTPGTKGGIISNDEWKSAKLEKEQIEDIRSHLLKKKKKIRSSSPKRRSKRPCLSFDFEDEVDSVSTPSPLKKPRSLSKCRDEDIRTDFLPDIDRERREAAQELENKIEKLKEAEKVKNEFLEITYSFWDGRGHRRKIRVKKKSTILEYLDAVCDNLRGEFRALKVASGSHLMYIKEDCIIPHHLTFYELIISKARGLTGPLFHFDVHDDVRLVGNARIDKDDSHPGKVITSTWYSRNKHIYPASRWKYYVPDSQK